MSDSPSFETVRAALDSIPPDVGHDVRVRLAFAVFDGLGDAGADLWHAWAGRRAKPDAAEDRATWKSARKRGPVTVGTLFGLAKEHGFRFEAPQAPAQRPTPAELRARAEARRAATEREAGEREARQREAAAEALRRWEAASDTGASPYLQRKRVCAYGVRFTPAGDVLVPMRDAAGELVNVQTIRGTAPEGGAPGKLFLKGGRKTGAFHVVGDTEAAAWLLVAEGYATAATLHEATGRPVAVAFDAGNLGPVVRALRGRFPGVRLALCADDDRATAARTGRNPGRDKAAEAAKAAGKRRALVILPQGLPADGTGGSDFNDLAALHGLEAVRDAVESALHAAEAGREGQGAATDGNAPPATRQAPAQAIAADEAAGGRDRFRVDDAGLWFDPPGADDGEARPVRVCDPLHVEALGRDTHDNGAALLLTFDAAFRKGRRWLMPLAMLAGDGAAYRAELLAQGFVTPADAKRRALLTAYLQSRRPVELVRIVDRVGWHGRAYALPRETLGDGGGERVIFAADGPTEDTFGQRGTLESWQWLIARHCAPHSRLAFFVSLAFAGPLLAWAPGTDGGGFHLVGDSSCGKTTALRVAASVWGGPRYLQRWRATDNGLEALAAQHSDGLLCLDELAQLDPRVAGESAYLLANGAGKSRAGRNGAARPRLQWRLLFASAGEIGLAEHMAEAGRRTRAGQELRMIDLPADAGGGAGIFDAAPGDFDGPGALAQHFTQASDRAHGTAGRAWLLWLVDHAEGLGRTMRERVQALARDLVPEAAAGQVERVGRRFALVGAAGELATEAGITGWPAGTATAAARRCFNAWIEARPGGIGLAEDAAILRQVRGWYAANGEARFKNWDRAEDDHARDVGLRAGWRRAVKTGEGLVEVTGWEWFTFPDVFRGEIAKGYSERAALRLLAERGHLHRETEGRYTCRAKPPGAHGVQVYRVKPSILADLGD
jgi:putative DNA primase/helicase